MVEAKGLQECPFCKEPIRADALKCRFCGEWVSEPRHAQSHTNAPDSGQSTSVAVPTPTPTTKKGRLRSVLWPWVPWWATVNPDPGPRPSKGVLWWTAVPLYLLTQLNLAQNGNPIVIFA